MFCFCVSVLRRHLYRVSQMSSRHAFVRVARPRLFSWLLLLIGALSLLLSGAGSARAETQVSGTIGASVTWSVAQSPIVVTDDVTVDNGAVLSIDAGVTVRFAKGKSLTVQHGGLHAQGAAANPIVLTSVDDVAGGSPAAGDWGALRFLADTNDLATRLEHVRVRYGTGVWIERASPTINLTAIEHNQGPAISVDLHSSPIGIGLSASGNGLDGILVPAGTIYDDIVWGLVGIPYVLQQGTIQVGQAPILLDPAALTMNAGVAGSLRVTVANPAPAGGWHIDLTSSVPSVAGIPSSVLIAEGEQWADIAIAALSVGESTITASHAVFGASSASVKVAQLPTLRLQPATATIGTSRPQTMTLRLPEAAADTLIVSLSSANEAVATVPGSVAVAPGQDAVVFEVTGATAGQTVIAAHAQGYASAMAKVVVSPHTIVLPASVVVAPGDSIEIPVVLTDAAPAGGVTVDLSTTHPNVAMVSTPVHFPAGEFHRVVTVQGGNAGQTVLSAVASGYQRGSTPVTVDVLAVSFQPGADILLPKGQSRSRLVVLSKAAPAGGVYVAVASSDAETVRIEPDQVYVAEGLSTALEPIVAVGVEKGQAVVTAHANGMTVAAIGIEVVEPGLVLFGHTQNAQGIAKAVVGKGMQTDVSSVSNATVRLQRIVNNQSFNDDEAVTVQLSCMSESICSVPETITIPAGQNRIAVPVTGIGAGKTTLLASGGGYSDSNTLEIEVVEPALNFQALDGMRGIDSLRDNFRLSLDVPGGHGNATAAADMVVQLSISSAQPVDIVDGFYDKLSDGEAKTQTIIKAGSYASDYLYIGRPTAVGSYTVTAAIPGVGATVSPVQTVTSSALKLQGRNASGSSAAATLVGKGMTTYASSLTAANTSVLLQRTLNGSVFNGEEAQIVNLACADAGICVVPATVTIPAGKGQEQVLVTGVGVGKTTLLASAAGYGDSNALEIEVVEPVLAFQGLAGTRSVESVRDDFYVRMSVPGAYGNANAAVDLPVTLSISDAQPAGIVEGFYDKLSEGEAQTQTVIKAGSYDSAYRFVARPASAGSYSVTAALAEGPVAVSAMQTVIAPALALVGRSASGVSVSKAIVGHGMTTRADSANNAGVRLQRTLNGSVFAGEDAVVVSLSCASPSICTVPATVTIPAGQSQVQVPVTGVALGKTLLLASAAGYSDSNTIEIEVVAPVLTFQSLDGTRSTESTRDDFYLRLTTPGGYANTTMAADTVVALSISDAQPEGIVAGFYDAVVDGSVQAQTLIKAGHYDSVQRFVARPVSAGSYTVAATIADGVTAVSPVQTVVAPVLQVLGRSSAGVNTNKAVIGSGMVTASNAVSVRREIDGKVFNGAEAVTVSLSCASADVCTVPATVTIPAGANSAYIPVTGVAAGVTVITASAEKYDLGNDLLAEVVPAALSINGLVTSLSVGGSDTFYVSTSVPGGYGTPRAVVPIPVTLTNAVPGVASVTELVTIQPGASSSPNAVFTATAPGTTSVTASSPGFSPATSAAISVQ